MKMTPDYVWTRTEFVNGRNVRRYYAVYGRDERPITKKMFDKFRAPPVPHVRKQGGKRGAGEVPGAGHCWPMNCEALAVHPSQVEQMNERNKRHGVNVQYEPKHGLAVVPDEAAYRRLRKLEGVHHNNSYNG